MEKKICSNCGEANDITAKFCNNCGMKFCMEENTNVLKTESIIEESADDTKREAGKENVLNSSVEDQKENLNFISSTPNDDEKKENSYSNEYVSDNTPKKKKKFLIGIIACILLFIIIGIAAQPKIVRLSVKYEGDTSAGVDLDNDNDGIVVTGIDENGKEKVLSGWNVKNPITLKEDLTSAITITYKDLEYYLAVECTTSAIEEIYAEYSGNAEAGVVLDKNNSGIKVFAIHKNGDETEIEEGWSIGAPATLVADEKSVVEITYDNYSTELEVTCSTRTIEKITAKYGGSTKAGVRIGEGNEDITVTVHYKNGDKEEITDWTVENTITLETGKTSKLKIFYKDEECILKITCSDMTKKQYKEKCKSYSYNEVARDPDDYEDKYAKFSGKVLQVLEDSSTSLVGIRLAVNEDYDHVIYIYYLMPSGSSRILEDDSITVYGTMGGLYSYEAVSGATITIPLMYAQYID